MEENKNQGTNSPVLSSVGGILVKDIDGRLKMATDGELKELDSFLSAVRSPEITEAGIAPAASGLGFPKFTDLAPIPQDTHFQEPEVQAGSDGVADLHFHPEDKREIDRELEKISTAFSLAPQKKYSIAKIARKLVEKHSLRLSEPEIQTLIKILISYFRQTRNSVQTKSLLSGPKNERGLGIPGETVDHMLAIAKQLKQKIEETDGIVVEEDSTESSVPAPASIEAQSSAQPQPASQRPVMPAPAPKPVQQTPREVPKTAPENVPARPTSESTPVRPAQPFLMDDSAPAKAPAPVQAPVAPPTPPASPERAYEMPKVVRPAMAPRISMMADVRRVESKLPQSALTGRVEELALMDLATWRLLDTDPRIRAGKILGKIQNLEQESLTRKSQGIQAWRSNEVYQHYLMLGEQSLQQKKNVSELIAALEAQGTHTLTLDEFEAITDLNRMLRF